MPGIVGIVDSAGRLERGDAVVRQMRELLKHDESNVDGAVEACGPVIGSRTHTGVVNLGPQPVEYDGLHVWMEGELYNPQVLREFDKTAGELSDPHVLARLFRLDPAGRYLEQLNGVFCAVIYDSRSRLVHLISDRFGLRYLYYTIVGEVLAWSCETKAFLAVPGFDTTIDRSSLDSFFKVGLMEGDHTWFESAKLIPAAAWWTWSIDRNCFTERRKYWDWDRITPLTGKIDVDELAEEVARRFRTAVERRCGGNGQVGVSLSGGLDSRAVFASVPANVSPLPAVTLGRDGCVDIRLAKQVTRLRPSRHVVLDMNESNWLDNRAKCVWWTDGQQELVQAHHIVHYKRMRELFPICLVGYLGGDSIGGAYLLGRPQKTEFEFLGDRERRYIAQGHQQLRVLGHVRMPFIDNDFITLVMSIPPRYRDGGQFYFHMLCKLMPKPYTTIPWQATGFAPSQAIGIRFHIRREMFRVKRRLRRMLGLPPRNVAFHDYPRWVAGEVGRRFFRGLFAPPAQPLIRDLDTPFDGRLLDQESYSWSDTCLLCRAATLELWLQGIRQTQESAQPYAVAR